MTPEDWINAGYKEFSIPKINKTYRLADRAFQKFFEDEVGKRYALTVYAYDRSVFHICDIEPWGFSVDVQFKLGDSEPFFNVQMNAINSVEECEAWFEKIWVVLDKPYYRLWEEEN